MGGKAKARVIVFDIDGTLSNAGHRLHLIAEKKKDWDAFFAAAADDTPHDEVVYLNRLLSADPHNRILIVTGRPDHMRGQTESWLAAHGIQYHHIYFRPAGDRRDDTKIKEELLEAIIRAHGTPYLVFEDRSRVVQMWRARGIKCLQVDAGDF